MNRFSMPQSLTINFASYIFILQVITVNKKVGLQCLTNLVIKLLSQKFSLVMHIDSTSVTYSVSIE